MIDNLWSFLLIGTYALIVIFMKPVGHVFAAFLEGLSIPGFFILMGFFAGLSTVQYIGLRFAYIEPKGLKIGPFEFDWFDGYWIKIAYSHVPYWFITSILVSWWAMNSGLAATFFGLILVFWALFVTPLYFIGFFGLLFPTIAGLIALLSRPQVVEEVAKAASSHEPQADIERKLAEALKQASVDDKEIRRLLGELSPPKRWYYTQKYKIETTKQKQAADLLNAQLDAMKARREAATGAHEAERAKRRMRDM